MYLGIFVLAAFAMFGFAQSKKESELSCLACRGNGRTVEAAQKACNESAVEQKCKGTDMVCVVLSRHKGKVIRRGCVSRDRYNKKKSDCDTSSSCDALGMCETNGCKAELVLPISECPWCESFESLEDCDKNIEPEYCHSANARCFLKKQVYTDVTYYMRGCMDEETAKETSQECTEGGKDVCQFATCEVDKCQASFDN